MGTFSFVSIFVFGVLLLQSPASVQAFVKGSLGVHRHRPIEIQTARRRPQMAAAKKSTAAETLKKADLLNLVAEKLDSSKSEADSALTAVLETIQEVS